MEHASSLTAGNGCVHIKISPCGAVKTQYSIPVFIVDIQVTVRAEADALLSIAQPADEDAHISTGRPVVLVYPI